MHLDIPAGYTLQGGVAVGGAFGWSAPIPPSYVGAFTAQAVLLEPTANALGLVLSNALDCSTL